MATDAQLAAGRPRRRRRLALRIVTALAAFLLALVGAAYATTVLPAFPPVSSAAIAHSLRNEVGSSSAHCDEARPGLRRCWVSEDTTSDIAYYRVQMDGRRCWSARRTSAHESMPRTAHSCAHVDDQLRLVEREWP